MAQKPVIPPRLQSRRQGALWPWVLIVMMALAMLMLLRGWQDWQHKSDPQTVVASALQSLQKQNVLVPFTARYVAVVTSEQTRYGLSAQKTLIMPGTVRYEVDLGALNAQSLSWDPASQALTVTLPKLRLSGPEIDMTQIREFQQGMVLLSLTNAEQQLDAANRAAGQKELLRLASEETPLRLARNAARTAIKQNFELPLRAAGLAATVSVRLADEASAPAIPTLSAPARQATTAEKQTVPAQ